MTAGVVLVLAGLAAGDRGPGLGAARQAAAFNFVAGHWKGEGWDYEGGPWSLSLEGGTLSGFRFANRCSTNLFFLYGLTAAGSELRFNPSSSPPTYARLTYRVEGGRLIIRGGGCLFVLHPVLRLYLRHVEARWAARRLAAVLGGGTDADFWADERTNALLIRATPEKARRAREILRRLDVPTYFYSAPLRNADARVAAAVLAVSRPLLALVSDGREVWVTADVRANAVLISTTEATAEQLRRALRWLDGAGH